MMGLPTYQSVEVGDDSEKLEPATHHKFGFKINLCHTIVMAGAFLFLLFFAGYVSNMLVTSKSDCLGTPFLYISHQDSSNVVKYTRDGCPVSQNALWFGSTADSKPASIRSMAIHPYNNIKNALFVTNAGSKDNGDTGRILVFDTCAGLSGRHTYLKTLVDVRSIPGARHTYSLTFDGHGFMYVSFQHTDAVLRFSDSTFEPVSPFVLPWFNDLYNKDDGYNPSAPLNSKRNYTAAPFFYAGTFVQFGYPGLHDENTQGVRAIVWVEAKHQLWIANEDLHRVVIVDSNGKYVGKVKIKNPVGLIFDEVRGLVFVGSKKGSKSTGSVYGIDILTQKVVKTFTLLGGETMSHPTGLAVYGDILFVSEQSMNVVLTFNIESERFVRQIIGPMANDGIESITLSDC